jgi:hypothetical protein
VEKELNISDFSEYLFWDVDITQFDIEKNKAHLTQKVVEMGQLSDWLNLLKLYGKDEIKKTVLNLRSLSPVTLSFLSNYFNITPNHFRCYSQKRLAPNLWNS